MLKFSSQNSPPDHCPSSGAKGQITINETKKDTEGRTRTLRQRSEEDMLKPIIMKFEGYFPYDVVYQIERKNKILVSL